ncbi:hypothetical protein MP228_010507 [Amoeboaphelidium protococcarum]|nr:hypothetical protein MP228_010507 [Amoeboaphelidium protococcarum]
MLRLYLSYSILLLCVINGAHNQFERLYEDLSRDIIQRSMLERPVLHATEDPLHYFYRAKQYCEHFRSAYSADKKFLQWSLDKSPQWTDWCLSMEFRAKVYLMLVKMLWHQEEVIPQYLQAYGRELILYNQITLDRQLHSVNQLQFFYTDYGGWNFLLRPYQVIVERLSVIARNMPVRAYQDFTVNLVDDGQQLQNMDDMHLQTLNQMQFKAKRVLADNQHGSAQISLFQYGQSGLGVDIVEPQWPDHQPVPGSVGHRLWMQVELFGRLTRHYKNIYPQKRLEFVIRSTELEYLVQLDNYENDEIKLFDSEKLSHTFMVRFELEQSVLDGFTKHETKYARIIKQIVNQMRLISLEKDMQFVFDFHFRFEDELLSDDQCVAQAQEVYNDFVSKVIEQDEYMKMNANEVVIIERLAANGDYEFVSNDIVQDYSLTRLLLDGSIQIKRHFNVVGFNNVIEFQQSLLRAIDRLPQDAQAIPFEDVQVECPRGLELSSLVRHLHLVTPLPIKRYNVVVGGSEENFYAIITEWGTVSRDQLTYSAHFEYIIASHLDKKKNRYFRVVLEGDMELAQQFGALTRDQYLHGDFGAIEEEEFKPYSESWISWIYRVGRSIMNF